MHVPAAASEKHRLVIVESPAKARTIQGYLGPGFDVQASVGHIRDLPNSADEVPETIKRQPWGRLAIDVENGFRAYYVVPVGRRAKIRELKQALSRADELWLATDEDREGEAIAWHLREVLNPKVPVRRMVFHEITKDAIKDAAANTRELNQDLVDAQEARRLIDRLFGFEVSPVLWRKLLPWALRRPGAVRGHSPGRRPGTSPDRLPLCWLLRRHWDVPRRRGLLQGEACRCCGAPRRNWRRLRRGRAAEAVRH